MIGKKVMPFRYLNKVFSLWRFCFEFGTYSDKIGLVVRLLEVSPGDDYIILFGIRLFVVYFEIWFDLMNY